VRLRLGLLALSAVLVLSAPAAAAVPQVSARAWLVENAATGEVLLRHDDRESMPIASLTKLMTVLVALDHAELDDVVTVDPRAASIGESTMHLSAGEQVTVHDLIEGALVQSANDAAWALALYVGDGDIDRFVELMNARARRLGLSDTHFVRPDGLDAPGHVSSAHDITLLARVAMNNPVVRAVVRQRDAVAAGRSLHTWNDLLGSFPGLIGVKTGHTQGAGWSQVAAARGRGLTIYATILGSPSRSERNADLAELLAWGLSRYRVVALVRTGRVYARADAPYGRPSIPLVAERPLVRVVRIGRPLTERVVAPTAVDLPVTKGAVLGRVEVMQGSKLIGSRPLVAARTVEKPGLRSRVRWYTGRTLDNAWGIFS
jgi:D-alanyl-D-alanine carboxypeptidase (penicillin-binding protein 5/6)